MALTITLLGRGTTGGATIVSPAADSAASATFVAAVSYDVTAGTITTSGDNSGNTYTPVGTPQADSYGGLLRFYICEGGVGRTGHQFTFATSSNNFGVVHFFQVTSDSGGVARLDVNVQGQDTVGQPWDAVATGTLGYANEIIAAIIACQVGTAAYLSSNTTMLSSEGDTGSFWTSGVGATTQAGTTSFAPSFTKTDGGGASIGGISIITLREDIAPTDPITGAHTYVGQEEGSGSSPATTPSITTEVSGSSFLTAHAGYTSNNSAPTDSKSNTWVSYGSELYNGYGGAFNVRMYVAEDGIGGSGHNVSFTKTGYAAGEATVPLIEVKNADVLVDYAQNYPAIGNALTSGSVTTTGPSVLVAFWWGDGIGLTHTATPNNGFTVIESFVNLPPNSAVQMVVATKEVATAGTYDVTWNETPDQGAALWLFAFQKSGGGGGSSFDISLRDNGAGTFDISLAGSVQTVYIGSAGKAAVYLANSLEADMYKGALQLFP